MKPIFPALAVLGLVHATPIAAATVNMLVNADFEATSDWSADNGLSYFGPCDGSVIGCAPGTEAGAPQLGWFERFENVSQYTTQTLYGTGPGVYAFGVWVALGIAAPAAAAAEDFSPAQVSVRAQTSLTTEQDGVYPNDLAFTRLFAGYQTGVDFYFTEWMLLSGTLEITGTEDVLFNISLQQNYNPGEINDLVMFFDNAYFIARGGEDETPVVPLPASGLLLAGALGGVAAMRRRRRG